MLLFVTLLILKLKKRYKTIYSLFYQKHKKSRRKTHMKKRKTIFAIVLSAFALSITACSGISDIVQSLDGNHEHTFSNDWTYDANKHWHPSTCGHDVKKDESEHLFNDVVTPATYNADGYTTHTCSICGYSYKDATTKHEHVAGSPVKENEVVPTCTANGSYDLVKYCIDDNIEISREHVVVPALGHDLVHHDGQQATCTEAGWAAYDTCSRCDYTTYQVINATGHQNIAEKKENETNPSCTTDGSYDLVKYCTDDNAEISREHVIVPALGHDLVHHDKQDPTCTEAGWAAYDTCSRCDYTTYQVIEATGHQHISIREENRVEPTCTTDGSYDFVTFCEDDNAEISREQKTIPALGHDLIHHDSQDPTCTEAGWAAYDTCSRCNYSTKVVIPATGHQHLSTREENRVEATCTTDGSYDLVTFCTDDNAEINREHKTISALGHSLIHHDKQDPTCTSIGWEAYDTCWRCDYTTYKAINPTGHQHLSTREENRVEPNCTSNGSYDLVTFCTDDNVEISREQKTIPALGHDYNRTETEPTFERDGFYTYTCVRCGDTYTQKAKDKKPHNYSDVWSHDETNHWHDCIDSGYETLKGNIAGHSYNKEVTPPTGLSEGFSTYTCSVCGYSYVSDYVDRITYTVTWKNYDGKTLEIDRNVSYNAIPHYDGSTPTKAEDNANAYSFKGWSPEISPVTDNVTYIAQYDKYPQYVITYNLNDGTNNAENPLRYNGLSETITLKDPAKTGYTFIGWTGSNGDVPQKNVSFSGAELENRSYTANWELSIYSVNYILDGGTNAPKNPAQITIEDTIELKDASKTGYTFRGWYYDENHTSPVSSLSNISSDIDLFAYFVPNRYTVTYYSAPVENKIKITLDYAKNGDKATYTVNSGSTFNPYAYIKNYTGFTFDGWLSPSRTLMTADTNAKFYHDVTLTARYNAINNTTRYTKYLNSTSTTFNGTSSGPNYFYYMVPAAVTKISVSSRIYMNKTSQYKYELISSATIYSESRPNASGGLYTKLYSHQIKMSGSDTGTRNRTNEEVISVSPGEELNIGVSYGSSGSAYSENSSMTITILEKRETTVSVEPHAVTKNINYDDNIDSNNILGNECISDREGYQFNGWRDDSDNLYTSNDLWNFLDDTSLTADWSPTSYTINYELDGGTNSVFNPGHYTILDSIALENAEKPGYSFAGWYLDSGFTQPITSIEGRTGNLTLFAKYSVNTYTGTVDLDGGTLSPQVTYISDGVVLSSSFLTGNDSVTSYYPPEKDGYIFGGWYLDDGFQQVFNYYGQITDDLTLYAKWIENNLMSHSITSNSVETESISINGLNDNRITFVPIASGYLTITSVSDLDLKGTLYNQSSSAVMEADDISDDNFNFSMRYYVEAGHQYTISIKGATSLTKGDCEVQFLFEGDLGIEGITYDAYAIDVVYGNSFGLLTPTKEGYEFLGWYDESGNPIDFDNWSYAANITIYAHWRAL